MEYSAARKITLIKVFANTERLTISMKGKVAKAIFIEIHLAFNTCNRKQERTK